MKILSLALLVSLSGASALNKRAIKFDTSLLRGHTVLPGNLGSDSNARARSIASADDLSSSLTPDFFKVIRHHSAPLSATGPLLASEPPRSGPHSSPKSARGSQTNHGNSDTEPQLPSDPLSLSNRWIPGSESHSPPASPRRSQRNRITVSESYSSSASDPLSLSNLWSLDAEP